MAKNDKIMTTEGTHYTTIPDDQVVVVMVRVPRDWTMELTAVIMRSIDVPKACQICLENWQGKCEEWRCAHLKKHSKRKPRNCSYCEFSSRSVTSLRKHNRGHGVAIRDPQ